LFQPPKVKICCIADEAEARLAVQAGAAALGLVSAMPSGPGVISDAQVAHITTALRDTAVRTFLLTARTQALDIANQHAAAGATTLQLVDHVDSTQLRVLRALLPTVELVQVIHVTGVDAIEQALAAAPLVDAILLDSGNPKAAVKELGGTGRTHDWALARRIRDAVAPTPLWLAGGLRADNVAVAIHTVQPYGLDLCSSVRSMVAGRSGLDPVKLHAFMAAVRATARA
jgi:phosphoribosylanthranilate isomerase